MSGITPSLIAHYFVTAAGIVFAVGLLALLGIFMVMIVQGIAYRVIIGKRRRQTLRSLRESARKRGLPDPK